MNVQMKKNRQIASGWLKVWCSEKVWTESILPYYILVV